MRLFETSEDDSGEIKYRLNFLLNGSSASEWREEDRQTFLEQVIKSSYRTIRAEDKNRSFKVVVKEEESKSALEDMLTEIKEYYSHKDKDIGRYLARALSDINTGFSQ